MNTQVAPFALPNIKRFIAFRVFFNARFYYPVFTILFLDYGLTIEQFALLNSVWAATIVLTEVPSGALADILGRKILLIATTTLMILEMAVISFVPLSNINLIFWAFLLNRVLSGLAEAMASGADEAIAYDTLVRDGNPKDWPRVLSLQMRISAIASIITAALGAAIYDADFMNRILSFLSADIHLSQQDTMRFPVYATLILSMFALYTVLRMEEPVDKKEPHTHSTLRASTIMTLEAGKWILKTPFAFAVIIVALSFDHVQRMMVTMTSQYYRLIDLPEAIFGILGGLISVLGILVPKIAENMVEKLTPVQNTLILGTITLIGFLGLNLFIPYFGIIPMGFIFTGIMMTSFFTSHYLNEITESKQRATVLSFKGLAFNLAYGLIGILFALLMNHSRETAMIKYPDATSRQIEDLAFHSAVGWFPGYTIIILGLACCCCIILFLRENNTQ